jgi:hypothetical protein
MSEFGRLFGGSLPRDCNGAGHPLFGAGWETKERR